MISEIKQKLKSAAAFLIILILLPYVASVFAGGGGSRTEAEKEQNAVKLKICGADGRPEDLEIGLQEYMALLLASEMQRDSGEEALKAQAVLIRTNIYRKLSGGDKTLEINRDTWKAMREKQGSADFREQYERCARAVEDTEGIALWYEDGFPWLPFHQSSNGMTRSAQEVLGSKEYPYIAVKECPYDKEAEDERSVYFFGFEEIQDKCRDFLVAEKGEKEAEEGYGFSDFEILSRDSAGYVKELRIGNTVCTGDRFRDALSLASCDFYFDNETSGLKITTTGRGHGMGMSLRTANEMAGDGKTYDEILKFFFDGTVLKENIAQSGLI